MELTTDKLQLPVVPISNVSQKKKDSVYFPGLNTLRFVAAYIVIVYHIEIIKANQHLPSLSHIKAVDAMGKLGVILFFVLSGFLITYLLLAEKNVYNSIDVRKFYMRRVLRIWPLYYFILGLSFVVLFFVPGLQIGDSLIASGITPGIILLYIFFLPNLALALSKPLPFFAQSWSVGVEEQFYFVWPLLLRRFKNTGLLLGSILFIYLFVKLGLFGVIKYKLHYWNETMNVIKAFWNSFLIDTMAIGGLFSYAYYKKSAILKFFYHPATQLISYGMMLYLFISGMGLGNLKSEIFSVLFGILILNVATNKKLNITLLNTSVFQYLGKISYGVYMYHSLCIILTIKVMIKYDFYNNVLLYIIASALTILVSAVSYHYFERYFLSLKDRFTRIKSSDHQTL